MCRTLLAAVLAMAMSGLARADEQADAKAILETAIKAQGSDEAVGKFTGIYFKAKGKTLDEDNKWVPILYESYMQGNNKMRTVNYDVQNKVESIDVLNGKEGWTKEKDKAAEALNGEQIKQRLEMNYLSWATMLVPLRAPEYRLFLLNEIDVAGKKAEGILIHHDGHEPVKLYFDKDSHLLVKYEFHYKNADVGQEVDETCVFSDYKTVQDVKQPMKIEQSWDGVKIAELEITDMKFNEKPLDDKLFVKP
jgi:hypothetical protein